MRQSLSTNLKHVAFGSKVQIYDNLRPSMRQVGSGGRSHPLYPGDYMYLGATVHDTRKPLVLLHGRRGLPGVEASSG
jgi:hypothetical protein